MPTLRRIMHPHSFQRIAKLTLFLLLAALASLTRGCAVNVQDLADGFKHFAVETTPGCSTNRAFGYSVGKEFRGSIEARIKALGPQLQKAIVSRSAFYLVAASPLCCVLNLHQGFAIQSN